MYQTVNTITTMTTWLSGILTACLVVRCLRDGMKAYENAEENGLKDALVTMKRRIFAVIIGLTATGLCALISSYY